MQISAKTVSLGNKKIKFTTLEEVTDVKSGLGTGDNQYYLYKDKDTLGSYEIIDKKNVLTENELKKISSDEKLRLKMINNGIPKTLFNGKTIIPTDKGGESDIASGRLSNYFVPTKYYLDFSQKNVTRLKTLTIADRKRFYKKNDIKQKDATTLAAVIRNPTFYFLPGITFSDVGLYAPTFRLNSSSVFDHRGNCIFIKKKYQNILSIEFLLGIICSIFIRYLNKNFINNTVGFQVEDIKKLLIPICEKSQKQEIEKLVEEIIKKQKKDPDYNYQNHEQIKIDKLVYEIFGLDQELIDEVETWYARRYPKLVRN